MANSVYNSGVLCNKAAIFSCFLEAANEETDFFKIFIYKVY